MFRASICAPGQSPLTENNRSVDGHRPQNFLKAPTTVLGLFRLCPAELREGGIAADGVTDT